MFVVSGSSNLIPVQVIMDLATGILKYGKIPSPNTRGCAPNQAPQVLAKHPATMWNLHSYQKGSNSPYLTEAQAQGLLGPIRAAY